MTKKEKKIKEIAKQAAELAGLIEQFRLLNNKDKDSADRNTFRHAWDLDWTAMSLAQHVSKIEAVLSNIPEQLKKARL